MRVTAPSVASLCDTAIATPPLGQCSVECEKNLHSVAKAFDVPWASEPANEPRYVKKRSPSA